MHLFSDLGEACLCEAPLAPLTWFKLGGPAEYLIEPRSEAQLATVLVRCREAGIPVRFLGLGANLLVSDAGVRGAVIRLSSEAFCRMAFDGGVVAAGAGVSLTKLVNATVKRGLAGLEVLAGIPGTVGGGIRMNCGGKYGEIGTTVRRVRVVTPEGEIVERGRDDLGFSYRHCHLGKDQVLGALFELAETDPEALDRRFREIWTYKQNSQPPMGWSSAGCIFRNPPGDAAGRLIDRAGLKGTRVGGAVVSEAHANFILAESGAKPGDVLALIDIIKDRVRGQFGVGLQTEVEIW